MYISFCERLENSREFVEQKHLSCVQKIVLIHIENVESHIPGILITFQQSFVFINYLRAKSLAVLLA